MLLIINDETNSSNFLYRFFTYQNEISQNLGNHCIVTQNRFIVFVTKVI